MANKSSSGRLARWLDTHLSRLDEAHVLHSWKGYELRLESVPAWRHLTAKVVDSTLAAVGHPCCGLGLGRVPFVSSAAYVVLVAALGLDRGVVTYSAPISPQEARAINPWLDLDDLGERDGEDSDGWVWDEGRFVAFRCQACGKVIQADTWPSAAEDQHAQDCTG
jgi:hypothetical protein